MLSTTIFSLAALSTCVSAHFRVLYPFWRGDSFTPPASQWIYPCANINATTDVSNRTVWPPSGGSIEINGSHPSALTQVNLGFGDNAVNFNNTLVEMFNQTGAGVFCMKSVMRDRMEAAFKGAGYSGVDDKRIDGLIASVQIIQIAHGGGSLYNCADIVFNSTAQLLSDDRCQNATGVGGVAIQNAQVSSTASSSSPQSTNGARRPMAAMGSRLLLVALLAWRLF